MATWRGRDATPGWPELLSPPVFEAEEDAQAARAVHCVAWAILLVCFPLLPPSYFVRPPLGLLSMLAVQILALTALWLNRQGRRRAAVSLLVLAPTVTATFFMCFSTWGSHGPSTMALPGTIALAGLALRRRDFLVLSGIVTACAVSVPIAEALRILPGCTNPHTDWRPLVDVTIILFITAVAVGRLSADLRHNLQRIREHEEEIQRDNLRLQEQSEQLLRSEQNYREVFNSANDAIFVHDAQAGLVTDINETVERMFGFTRADLIGSLPVLVSQGTSPYSAREAYEWIRKAAHEGPQVFEWRCRRKSGEEFWTEVSLRHAEVGGKPRVLALVRDIEERKSAQENLRRTEERYRTLVESTHAAILVLDPQGTVLFANGRAAATVHLSPADLAGRTLETLVDAATAETCLGLLRRALQQKGMVAREACITLAMEDHWFDVDASAISYNEAPALLVVGWDITDRKRSRSRLQQAEKMKALGQLAGGMAHDFNNHLTSILGYADLLGKTLRDDHLRHLAEMVARSATRSADLTRQLLAFSREGPGQRIPVDLHALLREVATLSSRLLEGRVTMRLELDSPHATTLGEATLLQNALLNLVVNARDAMPQGGELVLATREVELDATACANAPGEVSPGRFIRVSVADTGTGMDAQVKAHLFEPFFTTKGPGRGTGMGLAAVYGTVRHHQGLVDVESEVGHGTTVVLHLPLVDVAVAEESRALPVATVAGRYHVLVVDDEEMVRDLAADCLEELGYRCTICAGGSEALERFKASPHAFHLVLLDVIMPAPAGYETLLALREIHPDVRVVMASGYTEHGEAQKCLDEGAVALIRKPFKVAELAAVLGAALPQGAAGREAGS